MKKLSAFTPMINFPSKREFGLAFKFNINKQQNLAIIKTNRITRLSFATIAK